MVEAEGVAEGEPLGDAPTEALAVPVPVLVELAQLEAVPEG